ncbi:MAG: glycosyltransferase [Desulfocapsaceae bacterium]|nr:glycosyltransferase [Desulfocapsaceae bacterium]
MLIDIHVHSKYSSRPSQWILKKIGCPECFTEPLNIYQIARHRGMTHITISDHNSIDGALEIAHLPNTFISEEITTYFPDEGCKIHVLALNITEAQHAEIQNIRSDIYDLSRYLYDQNIIAVVAHPLYAINDRLTLGHFEQLVLLFQNFELNGARNNRENQVLARILQELTPQRIEELTNRHDLLPLHAQPWKKQMWGGSDDHSSLNITRAHTLITGIDSALDLRRDKACITPRAISQPATALTMGHNLYGIAYQFYCSKFGMDRYADKDQMMRFLNNSLQFDPNRSSSLLARLYLLWHSRKQKKVKTSVSDSLIALLRYETRQLMQDDPDFFKIPAENADFVSREERWFEFVNRSSKRVMLHFGNHLLDHVSGANVFNIFHTIGSAGGLYALLAPYFVAYAQFSKDRAFSETVLRSFSHPERGEAPTAEIEVKVAHFTDTFYEINGVALTLQQHAHFAVKNNKQYTVITCHKGPRAQHRPGVKNFEPIGTYDLPEYPEQQIFYPPVLEMLQYCHEEGFTRIHTATPGPIGLAALVIANILKLPISGTYHTAIPQYAQILTEDSVIEDLVWKYVLWYYDQLDTIYAPSQSTRDELIAKGIKTEKIRIYPRGTDVEEFHPGKRNGILTQLFNISNGLTLLYVGRVSKEKNLHLLADAFRRLLAHNPSISLVVAGDGPYLQTMQRSMDGLPCYFTGYLQKKRLSEVYASSDLFVFPSTTDTFGNVVLEAQASGLPVIVTDKGGPCENMLDGKTGVVVPGDDIERLLSALIHLTDDPQAIRSMGIEARKYIEERSFENSFLRTWQMYRHDTTANFIKAGQI